MEPAILLVDDELPVLFALGRYFSMMSYRVSCATTLEEAEALLAASQYAAVITDLRLSGTDSAEGLRIVELVRERYPATRAILMTAYGSPDHERAAYAAGVDAFLLKPTPLRDVARVVSRLLDTQVRNG